MQRISHKTFPYILNPTHELTVTIVGVGGTGSQVLNILARMHIALKALGHPGFMVYAYDADVITEANIGRQSFYHFDVGQNKAQNLIHKINMAYGLNWYGLPEMFNEMSCDAANIFISCADNINARLEIAKLFKGSKKNTSYPYLKPYYWLDFGNSNKSGQAILASIDDEMKNIFHFHPEIVNNEDMDTPSCSMIEALDKQDLLINSTLANLGMNMIWRLFRNLEIDYNGLYLNLENLFVTTIPIWHKRKTYSKRCWPLRLGRKHKVQ